MQKLWIVAFVVAGLLGSASSAQGASSGDSRCTAQVGARGLGGKVGVKVAGRCVLSPPSGSLRKPRRKASTVVTPSPDPCVGLRGVAGPVEVDLASLDAARRWVFCNAPRADPSPRPSPRPGVGVQAVAAEAVRLLPLTQVGTTATVTGFTRPNIQTIFWAATSPVLDLGSVTLVGQRFGLKAVFGEAVWDFGDGTGRVHSDRPGKAYVPGSCNYDALCPEYFGHVYRVKGKQTVTLRVSWRVSYTVGDPADQNGWIELPAVLTTAATTATVNIIANRAILIPNDDD